MNHEVSRVEEGHFRVPPLLDWFILSIANIKRDI